MMHILYITPGETYENDNLSAFLFMYIRMFEE